MRHTSNVSILALRVTLLAALVICLRAAQAEPPRPATVFAYGYTAEPYHLDPGPHLFIDWRYIYAGMVRYAMPDGKEVGKEGEGLTVADIPAIRARADAPFGIRLETQPGRKSDGPLLKVDKPWEYLFAYSSMIKVDDEYRIYYEAIPSRDSTVRSLLCLATSKDGVSWTKPELGLMEFEGSKANNILFGGDKVRHGMHGHQVFIDPNGSPEERFKMVYMANVKESDPELIGRLKAKRPESVNPLGEEKFLVIMGAASPDGLNWTEREEPLMAHVNDSGPAVYWDEKLERYVGYWRFFVMGRRAIGRAETSDFWHWPAPELVLWTQPFQGPYDDYYTNSHALYPGTKTMHLMFPALYQRNVDGGVIRMATSVDGLIWEWPDGPPANQGGPQGSWDHGWLTCGVGMQEIPGDKVILLYNASPLPHKFPRVIPLGQIGTLTWPKERLCALTADEDGEFRTPSLAAEGDQLFLNFDTARTGGIKVEVSGVAGRSFDDCDPLWGDEIKKQVTWGGEGSLGVKPGESFNLRFRLHRAKLFSFEMKSEAE